ncbi:unnamed protein product [Spirodela intermedia]|uniref:Uncharacterized protein n=2 Tax=Spirodela intermedia TaxID=51605 RepID=A0A7I8IMW2_SPIIN|nr:unnamed protein product [Spirodela intermedia]CAA6658487.1 unnamed protein product [Spirodela intermedia]CAA7394753.1 unnamed protein product [Spirodela intermedia]
MKTSDQKLNLSIKNEGEREREREREDGQKKAFRARSNLAREAASPTTWRLMKNSRPPRSASSSGGPATLVKTVHTTASAAASSASNIIRKCITFRAAIAPPKSTAFSAASGSANDVSISAVNLARFRDRPSSIPSSSL